MWQRYGNNVWGRREELGMEGNRNLLIPRKFFLEHCGEEEIFPGRRGTVWGRIKIS
jgi:hypothetical protein